MCTCSVYHVQPRQFYHSVHLRRVQFQSNTRHCYNEDCAVLLELDSFDLNKTLFVNPAPDPSTVVARINVCVEYYICGCMLHYQFVLLRIMNKLANSTASCLK